MVGERAEPDRSNEDREVVANAGVPTPTVSTLDLLGSRRELFIDHRGEVYRLRITRNDKLILTK